MKVQFFVTCLCDGVKQQAAKDSFALLERLGCDVEFKEAQTCCAQPLINSGYNKMALESVKNLISLYDGDEPVVSPSGSCVGTLRSYSDLFDKDDIWHTKALNFGARCFELTDFIVNTLKITQIESRLKGRAVYHPSCAMLRKISVISEPLLLLKGVKDLEVVEFKHSDKCCGFGGTFALKLGSVSGEMVKEKVECISAVNPDFLIGADMGCLVNIAGRMEKEGKNIKPMHISQVLMSK